MRKLKLKPCPFCGKPAKLMQEEISAARGEYWIECEGTCVALRFEYCPAEITEKKLAKKLLLETWDRRVGK